MTDYQVLMMRADALVAENTRDRMLASGASPSVRSAILARVADRVRDIVKLHDLAHRVLFAPQFRGHAVLAFGYVEIDGYFYASLAVFSLGNVRFGAFTTPENAQNAAESLYKTLAGEAQTTR